MFEETIERYRNILHIRFSDVFFNYPAHTLNKISPANPFRRLLKINLYTIGRLIPNLFSPAPKNQNLEGKIWFYVVSQNNFDALSFLQSKFPDAVMVAGQHKQIGRYNKQVNRLSLRYKFFYTFQFFPVWLGLYNIHGSRAWRFFDLIFVALGFYESYKKHLKKYRPACVVFANDHNDDSRAMLLAAKELQIPTIYIQHASVSPSFPPLEFDLNLLEGQDAWDKYRQCGPISGEVALIGMPKADKFLHERNVNSTINRIGIAGNLLDDHNALKNLITETSSNFPDCEVTFRPHPGDKREYSFVTQIGRNTRFSNPAAESAFEFLKTQDLIIAAESSIHLEAALLNIPGIYFHLGNQNLYDYYGYVKHGLIAEAKDLPALIALIKEYQKNKPNVITKAAYYNATIGTEMEGKSHALATNYIETFLKNGRVSAGKTQF